MKTILLTRGKMTLVDDCDFDWLNQWRWYACRDGCNWYARRAVSQKPTKTITMHRIILGAPKTQRLDHINNNGLDNQRKNLRFATASQNGQNRRANRDTISKYKGVYWNNRNKRWCVSIKFQGRRIWVGSFIDEKAAAYAYDQAALKHHVEFAKTNQMMGLL